LVPKKDEQTKQRRQIVVRAGRLVPPAGPSVEVSITPVVVGRDKSCDIVLPDDQEVSEAHCEVLASPEGVLVRDLGSSNGTFVGPVRVREAYLNDRCTLVLGSSTLLFEPAGKEHVQIASEARFGQLVGGSTSMRRLFQQLREVAPTSLSALITGETGTGKELVARAIHEHSPRSKGPFVVVDCTTIVPSLAESLLFGHEPGAFTGADRRTDGAFHEAHGGTLFLDEIGELLLDLQPKLLRALAERRVKRLMGRTYQDVDVRVIAATHQDLLQNINLGRFRSDLFFRLAQVRLALPPLRDRREDIPAIVRAVCARFGHPERADQIVELAADRLEQHNWPGNVRELSQLTEAIAALPPDSVSLDNVLPDSVPLDTLVARATGRDVAGPSAPFSEAKRAAIVAFEQHYFRSLHEATQGNVSEMARRSGMERHHVRGYLKKLGIKGPGEG
jgi:DNA-binding NtrC family response regulator